MPQMQDVTVQAISLPWGTNFFYSSKDLLTSLLKYERNLKQEQSIDIRLTSW